MKWVRKKKTKKNHNSTTWRGTRRLWVVAWRRLRGCVAAAVAASCHVRRPTGGVVVRRRGAAVALLHAALLVFGFKGIHARRWRRGRAVGEVGLEDLFPRDLLDEDCGAKEDPGSRSDAHKSDKERGYRREGAVACGSGRLAEACVAGVGAVGAARAGDAVRVVDGAAAAVAAAVAVVARGARPRGERDAAPVRVARGVRERAARTVRDGRGALRGAVGVDHAAAAVAAVAAAVPRRVARPVGNVDAHGRVVGARAVRLCGEVLAPAHGLSTDGRVAVGVPDAAVAVAAVARAVLGLVARPAAHGGARGGAVAALAAARGAGAAVGRAGRGGRAVGVPERAVAVAAVAAAVLGRVARPARDVDAHAARAAVHAHRVVVARTARRVRACRGPARVAVGVPEPAVAVAAVPAPVLCDIARPPRQVAAHRFRRPKSLTLGFTSFAATDGYVLGRCCGSCRVIAVLSGEVAIWIPTTARAIAAVAGVVAGDVAGPAGEVDAGGRVRALSARDALVGAARAAGRVRRVRVAVGVPHATVAVAAVAAAVLGDVARPVGNVDAHGRVVDARAVRLCSEALAPVHGLSTDGGVAIGVPDAAVAVAAVARVVAAQVRARPARVRLAHGPPVLLHAARRRRAPAHRQRAVVAVGVRHAAVAVARRAVHVPAHLARPALDLQRPRRHVHQQQLAAALRVLQHPARRRPARVRHQKVAIQAPPRAPRVPVRNVARPVAHRHHHVRLPVLLALLDVLLRARDHAPLVRVEVRRHARHVHEHRQRAVQPQVLLQIRPRQSQHVLVPARLHRRPLPCRLARPRLARRRRPAVRVRILALGHKRLDAIKHISTPPSTTSIRLNSAVVVGEDYS